MQETKRKIQINKEETQKSRAKKSYTKRRREREREGQGEQELGCSTLSMSLECKQIKNKGVAGIDQSNRSSPASPHQVSSSQKSKARRTEGKFETGPLLSVAQSLRRSITVVFIVSGKPGKLVFPFVFLCLILRGALHCAKVN